MSVPEKFEVKLCNSVLAFLIGLPLLTLAFVTIGNTLIAETSGGEKAAIIILLAAVLVGVYKLLKWLVTRQAIVEVWAEELVIKCTGKMPVVIPFAEVKSYKHDSGSDREELMFKLKRGGSRKISVNSLFGPTGDMSGLIQALEAAVARYRLHNPDAMVRTRSFFECRISTVLLVIASILMIYTIGKGLIMGLNESEVSALLRFSGVYIAYAGIWRMTARRRSQPLA